MRRAGQQLRARVWDPLTEHLTGVSRIFIVPENTLHLVTWDALPDAAGGYLIEHAPLIHYLSAERDLALAEERSANRGLLMVDSPRFDNRSTPPAAALRGAEPECDGLAWLHFDPLPASTREAESIVRIWKSSDGDTQRLSGQAATEAALKQRAAGNRVLHLATHAFFQRDRCNTSKSAAAPRQDAGELPLLLAGLAFSGANNRQSARPDEEDGILTAEEVAGLDLRGLEWAVLSGCDTGVGEVRTGEGVFGLRRAFQVAGARTVVMSLWPVDDETPPVDDERLRPASPAASERPKRCARPASTSSVVDGRPG